MAHGVLQRASAADLTHQPRLRLALLFLHESVRNDADAFTLFTQQGGMLADGTDLQVQYLPRHVWCRRHAAARPAARVPAGLLARGSPDFCCL